MRYELPSVQLFARQMRIYAMGGPSEGLPASEPCNFSFTTCVYTLRAAA